MQNEKEVFEAMKEEQEAKFMGVDLGTKKDVTVKSEVLVRANGKHEVLSSKVISREEDSCNHRWSRNECVKCGAPRPSIRNSSAYREVRNNEKDNKEKRR